MLSLNDFITKYTGQSGVGDTTANIGQCVGLIEVFTDNLGLSHTWGNADELMANADPNSFDVIQNSPSGVPVSGDIVCWSSAYNGTVGHTGIFVSGDTNNFQCFEQNDPDGSTPHIKQYDYTDVMGWLHPKVSIPTTQVLNTYGIDPTNTASVQVVYDTWHAVSQGEYVEKSQLDSANTTIDSLNQIIKDKTSKIDTLTTQVTEFTTQLTTKDQTITTLQSQADKVVPLQAQLSQAENDRQICLSAQGDQNKLISNLKAQLIAEQQAKMPTTLWGKIKFLFNL